MVSRNRRLTFKSRSDRQLEDAAQRIEDHFAGQRDVRLGGEQIANAQANTQVGHDLAHAELLAFPFIFLLSLLFFRSLVAALLPPLLGGVAIVATFFALRIVSSFADLSVFALNFVTGMGLGLAIDYSLFMVSRYREEAATSGFGLETLRRTLQTADGRSCSAPSPSPRRSRRSRSSRSASCTRWGSPERWWRSSRRCWRSSCYRHC